MPKGEANPLDPRGSTRRAEFELLYEQHSREVWALAYARWMDSDQAMDVTQEAFLRLWKQWEAGGEDIQNPRAWLLRVARNLAEDYAKSAFRRNGTQPPELLNGVRSAQPLARGRVGAAGTVRSTTSGSRRTRTSRPRNTDSAVRPGFGREHHRRATECRRDGSAYAAESRTTAARRTARKPRRLHPRRTRG